MELKEFVKDVLFEIVEGVKLAQEEIPKEHNDVMINPSQDMADGVTSTHTLSSNDLRNIEMDIAIEYNQTSNAQGGVMVAVFKAGGKIESGESIINRVKFSIPVFLPFQKK